jgi:hypothetical protein
MSDERDDYSDLSDEYLLDMAWGMATQTTRGPRLLCLPEDKFKAMQAKAAQYDRLREACAGVPEMLEDASRWPSNTDTSAVEYAEKAAALRAALGESEATG